MSYTLDVTGSVSFVFSIDNSKDGVRRWFKRDGYQDSYDSGDRFDGSTTEVEPSKQAVITTNWKAI